MEIQLIGVPLKYGCFVDGADMAYDYLKDDLIKILTPKVNERIDNNCDNIPKVFDNKIKYIGEVMEINKRLYNSSLNSLTKNHFPFIVGGDHSLAIGSIKASLDYYHGDISVIYIDKHADIHNHKTTPSGNIHGMPLSVCIGRCDERFNIGKFNLKPENLFYLGLCNYEKEEIDYINQEHIYNVKDSEIDINNIKNIISDLKSKIKTKHIHLSFDLDSICDNDFHAVNVSVNNFYQDSRGMNFETTKKLLFEIFNNFKISSMDIVEYNPLLDQKGIYKKKIEELIKMIKPFI